MGTICSASATTDFPKLGNRNNHLMSVQSPVNEKKNYPNGDIYIGDLLNNQRSGHGKMIYANGDIYQGEWEKDEKGGETRSKSGIMSYKNDNIYIG